MAKYKRLGSVTLFDTQNTKENLSALGNPLERLSQVFDFEMFRNALEDVFENKKKKNNAGAKPYDVVMMFMQCACSILPSGLESKHYSLLFNLDSAVLMAYDTDTPLRIVQGDGYQALLQFERPSGAIPDYGSPEFQRFSWACFWGQSS
ncbi:MAG: hypothetical protein KBT28_03300 [Bacteroidales bacterium]|nr:hypothetical protein [Candidatus Colimorpha merdihippi]